MKWQRTRYQTIVYKMYPNLLDFYFLVAKYNIIDSESFVLSAIKFQSGNSHYFSRFVLNQDLRIFLFIKRRYKLINNYFYFPIFWYTVKFHKTPYISPPNSKHKRASYNKPLRILGAYIWEQVKRFWQTNATPAVFVNSIHKPS